MTLSILTERIPWLDIIHFLLWNEWFFIFTLIVIVKYLEIMIFDCLSSNLYLWSLYLWLFICDLFICDSSSVISSSVTSSSVTLHLWSLHLWLFICAFIFHLWLGTLHWKHKRYQTWKMPYGINNNIFHKLQEKKTLAFSNWTLQIKSLMKSAHAKHFQKLVRCNSYLGPLITSPP